MTVNLANSFVQEGKSCPIAITGMSCSIRSGEDLKTFWQNLVHDHEGNESTDLSSGNNDQSYISLLSKLAIAAFADAGLDQSIYSTKKISIIIGHYSGITTDHQSYNDQDLDATRQLCSILGWREPVAGICAQIRNPIEGFSRAADRLQFGEHDVVLLFLLENPSFGNNIDSAAAFVLKRLLDVDSKEERAYASVAMVYHEELVSRAVSENRDERYKALKAIYQKAKIQTRSIELLAVGAQPSVLKTTVAGLAQCLSESEAKLNIERIWCSVKEADFATTVNSKSFIALMLETILSLQQKVLLPAVRSQRTKGGALPHPFYSNASMRPWFCPQIYGQFMEMSSQLVARDNVSHIRHAALHYVDHNGQFSHLILGECEDRNEASRCDLNPQWDSEVFTFFANSRQQLFQYIEMIKKYLPSSGQLDLRNLAFTINDWTKREIDRALAKSENRYNSAQPYVQADQKIRAAFVCASVEDLANNLTELASYCLNDHHISNGNIRITEPTIAAKEISQGKLAFVLPGLGAAYPDMLKEMCLHFPEVRAIFDFVDYLALSAGGQFHPSSRIFPRRDLDARLTIETPASLAMMDSAVVTVLMAEWAIFTLLLNIGITPDMLLGCSTGEFAALTMSGAIDILGAAPLFYHLSTGLSKALPLDRLINLRSLKINAAFEDVEQELMQYSQQIYLSADLSREQLIVTGEKGSINLLSKSLEDNGISADFLPFAIPYHTSLVADVVSLENPDVQALQISQPLIESWSCSLADKYPSYPSQIRKISTELFSKPILFRKSIEKLYASGVRKFVEVGPRGSLSPVVSQTLRSSPHISLATNRADCSTLGQLNNILADLFTNGVYIDLSYLYQRRLPMVLPIFENVVEHCPNAEAIPERVPSTSQGWPADAGESSVSSATDIIPKLPADNYFRFTASFQNDLRQLEHSVISALQEKTQRNAAPCAVLDPSFHPAPSRDQFIGQKILLAELFPHLSLNSNLTGQTACQLIRTNQLPPDEIGLLQFAKDILSSREIETFQSFKELSKRRQWIAGRLALKESIRSLICTDQSVSITNSEIEIGNLESGKIYVSTINNMDYPYPVISLSHKEGKAIAVAADCSIYFTMGIDLEICDLVDDSLVELILSVNEQNHIKAFTNENKNVVFRKVWAAKEAVAKALGLGLPEVLKKLVMLEYSQDMNQIVIEAPKILEPVLTSESAIIQICAHVASIDDMIFALSFLLN